MEEWAPVAWAKTLSDLGPANLLPRGWSAWPAEEHDPDSYWFHLAHSVTKQIVGYGLSLFPNYDRERLVSIHGNSVLFTQQTDDNNSLFSILSLFGVYVVQPPPHIFSALQNISNSFQASTLSPHSLHKLLRGSLTDITKLSHDIKVLHTVMDYLALTSSPPTLKLLSDLPWFSRTDRSLVSLTYPSTNPRWIIPATEEEALLFVDDSHMLAWDCVSDDLRVHLLKAQTAEVLNVTSLNVALVAAFLKSRFSLLDRCSDEHHLDFLFRFWTWVARWPARESLFKTQISMVQDLHLLPTSHKSLRKMSSQVVIFQNVPREAVEAWGALGVHGLHDSIPRDAVSILKEKSFALDQSAPGFVSLLIRSCDINCRQLLDQNSFKHIRDSLTSGVRLENEPKFSLQDKEKLLELPVFMIRHHPGERSTLGPASGKRVLINLPENYPLPRLEHIVYIDMGDFATASLIRLVDHGHLEILNELDILKLSVENWDSQPMYLQDRFISNIFDNRRHTSALRERLKTLHFVSVNQVDYRVPPRGLIHPHSPLAVLYEGEAGRLPTGRFCSSDYLLIMQSEGFVDSVLNDSIIQERIDYFSSADSKKEPISRKATAFVEHLNKFWESSYRHLILCRRSMAWFPSNDLTLVSPDRCRDSYRGPHAHPYYYDLCLRVLDRVVVSSPGFRSALGWSDPIPSYILVEQLRHTLKPKLQRQGDRLIELLNYLGQRHSEGLLTSEVADDLKQVVDGQLWIPVTPHSLGSHDLARSKYAVLSESGLRPPFRRVDPQLKHHRFLLQMGCTQRYFPLNVGLKIM